MAVGRPLASGCSSADNGVAIAPRCVSSEIHALLASDLEEVSLGNKDVKGNFE